MKKFTFLILLLVAMNANAESNFYAGHPSAQLENSAVLGDVEIEDVGAVRLTARKNGTQLTVHAQDASGKVIGKAETVIGLNDTPIYILTSDGIKKITIYWSAR